MAFAIASFFTPTTDDLRRFMAAASPTAYLGPEEARKRGLTIAARVGKRMVALFWARPAFRDETAEVMLQVVAAVDQRFQGIGIGTQGTKRLVNRCFELPRTELVVLDADANSPSERVAEKLGFSVVSRGEHVLLALRRDEFTPFDTGERH